MVFLKNADKDRDDSLSNGSESASSSTVSKENEVKTVDEQQSVNKDAVPRRPKADAGSESRSGEVKKRRFSTAPAGQGSQPSSGSQNAGQSFGQNNGSNGFNHRPRPGFENPRVKKDFNGSNGVDEKDMVITQNSTEKKTSINVKDLKNMGITELIEYTHSIGLENVSSLHKHEIIYKILESQSYKNLEIFAEGILERLQEGFGFLRSSKYNYTPGADDVYVSPVFIKKFALRTGDLIRGTLRAPREGEKFFALQRVESVNLKNPFESLNRTVFENLTPIFPNKKFVMEGSTSNTSARIMDLICPIGKGQRALIVAPPRTGKTVFLKDLANSMLANNPGIVMIILLVDERPEEVTDMTRSVNAEVVSSTFDEYATRHVQVAEMVLEKAKRLVECGHDVVILLDSITRLARAYNAVTPSSGKVLSGGVDANALHRPKRFFGAARNVEEGGSLTIIATALVDTGSKMDEVIFEEFKGTGNMEIHMTRKLANKRVYPAFDVHVSGTRREDLMVDDETLKNMWILQRFLSSMGTSEAMEFLIEKVSKTANNQEFWETMNKRK